MAFQDIEPVESGNYYTDSFVDTLKSITFEPKTIGEDVQDMVTFGFESGKSLDFFQPEDWGAPEDWKGVGRVISDIRKSGYKFQVDLSAMKIQTVPSIIGAVISFKLTTQEKTVKGNPKTYYNWNIDNIQLPDGNEESKSNDVDDTKLMDTTIENLTRILKENGPLDMRGILPKYKLLVPDNNVRLPQLKIKMDALEIMEADGTVEKKGEEYHLVEE